ncbi:MAG: LPS export ABC transporter permease LptG [Alphaproteobacteria bacterium]|nr:LPS export ABC transporter permease LptG [Alphaproteobacteria bacterium]
MKPTSILGRYLTRQIILNFVMVLPCILGVIFLFEMVERLRKLSGIGEFGFAFALQMAVARLPKTAEIVFPFVVMIAAMITFWRLSKNSEFVVMRAAGISIWNFLTPVCCATLLIGVINVAVVNPVAADLYAMYETLERRLDSKDSAAMMFSSQGLWLREALPDDKVMVLQAKSLQHDDEKKVLLRGVTLVEFDEKSQPLRRIEAFAAVLEKGYFDLKDVKIYIAGKSVRKLNNMKYNTELDIHKIEENFVEPEAISFWKLPEVIHFYAKSGFAVRRHQMRFWSLMISPLFLIAMVLLAAVFSLRPNSRRGGVMFMIVSGIITGFSAYFLTQIVYAMGINGSLPIVVSVVAPTIIAGSIGPTLLLHLEDG